jgi:DNA-binding NarL/FixJ family response regulator
MLNRHLRPAGALSAMEKLRVLVADDYDLMRRAIVRLLESSFEVVGVVTNGQELVDAALELRPDVIVTDVAMPVLDGCAAMRTLHLSLATPFVLVSAMTRDVQTWINEGALCVVSKMDMHLDLVAAVNSAAHGEIYLSRSAVSM